MVNDTTYYEVIVLDGRRSPASLSPDMKKGTRNFLLALLAVVAALIVLVSIATISDAPRIPERHISTTQCIESSFGTKACLGMTKGEVASVWGQPSTVNRTVIENKSANSGSTETAYFTSMEIYLRGFRIHARKGSAVSASQSHSRLRCVIPR